jgi:hypothetical protein
MLCVVSIDQEMPTTRPALLLRFSCSNVPFNIFRY